MSDDTRVTISAPGLEPVETTIGGMKRAAKALKTDPALRQKARDIAKAHGIPQRHADAVADESGAPGIGHNSGDAQQEHGGVAGKRLLAFVERVERLEEEKAGLAEDIKDVYAEAKGTGFDTKTIRKLVRLRKMDAQKRREEDELLELYKSAIGMV